eukprot:m.157673 g.157673  ORF g.157673 m.157673 type:complete len:904 (-) comp16313_c6_seq1:1678-4389(-)
MSANDGDMDAGVANSRRNSSSDHHVLDDIQINKGKDGSGRRHASASQDDRQAQGPLGEEQEERQQQEEEQEQERGAVSIKRPSPAEGELDQRKVIAVPSAKKGKIMPSAVATSSSISSSNGSDNPGSKVLMDEERIQDRGNDQEMILIKVSLSKDYKSNHFSYPQLLQSETGVPEELNHLIADDDDQDFSTPRIDLAGLAKRWCTPRNKASNGGSREDDYDVTDEFIDDDESHVQHGKRFTTTFGNFYVCKGIVDPNYTEDEDKPQKVTVKKKSKTIKPKSSQQQNQSGSPKKKVSKKPGEGKVATDNTATTSKKTKSSKKPPEPGQSPAPKKAKKKQATASSTASSSVTDKSTLEGAPKKVEAKGETKKIKAAAKQGDAGAGKPKSKATTSASKSSSAKPSSAKPTVTAKLKSKGTEAEAKKVVAQEKVKAKRKPSETASQPSKKKKTATATTSSTKPKAASSTATAMATAGIKATEGKAAKRPSQQSVVPPQDQASAENPPSPDLQQEYDIEGQHQQQQYKKGEAKATSNQPLNNSGNQDADHEQEEPDDEGEQTLSKKVTTQQNQEAGDEKDGNTASREVLEAAKAAEAILPAELKVMIASICETAQEVCKGRQRVPPAMDAPFMALAQQFHDLDKHHRKAVLDFLKAHFPVVVSETAWTQRFRRLWQEHIREIHLKKAEAALAVFEEMLKPEIETQRPNIDVMRIAFEQQQELEQQTIKLESSLESQTSSDLASQGDDAKNKSKKPKKRFQPDFHWTEPLIQQVQQLYNEVKLYAEADKDRKKDSEKKDGKKKKDAQPKKDIKPEDRIKDWFKEHVSVLFPQGWMTIRELLRVCKSGPAAKKRGSRKSIQDSSSTADALLRSSAIQGNIFNTSGFGPGSPMVDTASRMSTSTTQDSVAE